ncbi:hypothetical protein RR46_00838 [Papilio xuthus]|uniref:Uncharacterized protein n=1 Tax=Papilio xuthus TaxID=66420 RepID=A0A0N1IN89_PAPXU|nr:hypothetical protein RR46_00838 [Papilio xuthus]
MGVRIEYKTAHEAEAVDVERVRRGAPPPHTCELDDAHDMRTHRDTLRNAQPPQMLLGSNPVMYQCYLSYVVTMKENIVMLHISEKVKCVKSCTGPAFTIAYSHLGYTLTRELEVMM